MSVKVGLKRKIITDKQKLIGLVLHEYAVHGQRAVNGLKSGAPVLGVGVFAGGDYLTYEEGLATILQAAIQHDDPKWGPEKLGHYIHVALAEQGNDFRSVFEKAWRYRLLMKIKEGEEATEEMIAKEKESAYTSVVRIFRGTPVDVAQRRPDVQAAPLTFNKDLAYLGGQMRALIDLRRLHETDDQEGFMLRFAGKYDPLIPEQAALVARAQGT